jgi:hypothetical protein
LRWKKITDLENTEPGHVTKNGVEIWALREQVVGKGISDDEICMKEWTRNCLAGKKERIRTGKGKGNTPLTDCMQGPDSKAVL